MTDVVVQEIETLATDVEQYAERVAGGLYKRIVDLINEMVAVEQKLQPYIVAGVSLLLSQEGQAALSAEVAAAPAQAVEAASGNLSGAVVAAGTAVAAAITSTVGANAAADAQTEIAAAETAGALPTPAVE